MYIVNALILITYTYIEFKECMDIMFFASGKDITTKLYSLTEQILPQSVSSSSRASSVPILLPGDRTVPARSVSADAVHTGNQGLVRSSVWRSNHRKVAARGEGLDFRGTSFFLLGPT